MEGRIIFKVPSVLTLGGMQKMNRRIGEVAKAFKLTLVQYLWGVNEYACRNGSKF